MSKIDIREGKFSPFLLHVEVNTKEEESEQRSRTPGPPGEHRDEGIGRCRAECQTSSCMAKGCGCLQHRGQAVPQETFGKPYNASFILTSVLGWLSH